MKIQSIRLSSIALFLACLLLPLSLSGQVPDTIYLLNHWRKSPQAGTLRAYMQRYSSWSQDLRRKGETQEEWLKRRGKLPLAIGWSCFLPAWRGIQDSIDLPVFCYHYVPYAYRDGLARFYVKDAPVMLDDKQLKSIHFSSWDQFTKIFFRSYEEDSIPPRESYKVCIIHVTRKGIWRYNVFDYNIEPNLWIDGCYLRVAYPYNYNSLYQKTEYELSPEEKQRQKDALKRLKRYGMGTKE